MKKNTAGQKIGVQMNSATDGSAFTGSVTVYVTGDAGTQAIGSVGSGVCTHEGNGYHTYAPAQAETNYDLIAFTFIGTGAIPATIQVETILNVNVVSQDNIDFGALQKTSLNAATPASVTGAVGSVTARVTANTDQWAGGTIPAPAVTGVPKVDLLYMIGSLLDESAVGRVVAAFKQFFNVASPTGTMKAITAVTTVTNLTNAPTAGDFNATMKTYLTGGSVAAIPYGDFNATQKTYLTGGNLIIASCGTVTNLTNAPTAGDFNATMKAYLTGGSVVAAPYGDFTATMKTYLTGGNLIIASCSGAVASVTGNVGGNVVGSVASVTGNVSGNVTGSVGSLAAQAQTDVKSAMTSQGYTTTRAGYLDTLNGLVAAIWDAATSGMATGIGLLIKTNLDTVLSTAFALVSKIAGTKGTDAIYDKVNALPVSVLTAQEIRDAMQLSPSTSSVLPELDSIDDRLIQIINVTEDIPFNEGRNGLIIEVPTGLRFPNGAVYMSVFGEEETETYPAGEITDPILLEEDSPSASEDTVHFATALAIARANRINIIRIMANIGNDIISRGVNIVAGSDDKELDGITVEGVSPSPITGDVGAWYPSICVVDEQSGMTFVRMQLNRKENSRSGLLRFVNLDHCVIVGGLPICGALIESSENKGTLLMTPDGTGQTPDIFIRDTRFNLSPHEPSWSSEGIDYYYMIGVDLEGSTHFLRIDNCTGRLWLHRFQNVDVEVIISGFQGEIYIDDTCTTGHIHLRGGAGKLTIEAGATITVISEGFVDEDVLDPQAIRDAMQLSPSTSSVLPELDSIDDKLDTIINAPSGITEKTVFVSSSGNDSNDGSSEFPIKSVDQAIAMTDKGDTIVIANGDIDVLVRDESLCRFYGRRILGRGGRIVLNSDLCALFDNCEVDNLFMDATGYSNSIKFTGKNKITNSTFVAFANVVVGGVSDKGADYLNVQFISTSSTQLGEDSTKPLTDVTLRKCKIVTLREYQLNEINPGDSLIISDCAFVGDTRINAPTAAAKMDFRSNVGGSLVNNGGVNLTFIGYAYNHFASVTNEPANAVNNEQWATGGVILTPQDVRDAMQLSPSTSSVLPEPDSVDDKLNDLATGVGNIPTNPLLTDDSRLDNLDAPVSGIPTNPLLTNDSRLDNLDAPISDVQDTADSIETKVDNLGTAVADLPTNSELATALSPLATEVNATANKEAILDAIDDIAVDFWSTTGLDAMDEGTAGKMLWKSMAIHYLPFRTWHPSWKDGDGINSIWIQIFDGSGFLEANVLYEARAYTRDGVSNPTINATDISARGEVEPVGA